MIEIACVVNDEDAVSAAQLIVGLGYDLTEQVTAALCYRIFVGFDANSKSVRLKTSSKRNVSPATSTATPHELNCGTGSSAGVFA
jgi:hypothetical protein